MTSTVLVLPGFGSSGEVHWQSLWEKKYNHFKRVEQQDWWHPVCEEWVASLEKSLQSCTSEVILVAHSMACLVVAHWASKQSHLPIKGALLVAVPDPQNPNFPQIAQGFENTPLLPFAFPSIVVASTDDKYASIDFAQKVAQAWGSEFVNVGDKGHINSESGLGLWNEGFELFKQLERGI